MLGLLTSALGRGIIGVAVVVALSAGARAQEEKPQYVGVDGCAKLCHKTAKQGEQLRIWQESAHSKAYATLATDAAKAIAKERGIADPQKADACLKCHVTGHGEPADRFDAKFVAAEESVGCEACHGAGSLYKKRSVMKDKEAAIAAGLVIPNEATCKKCHNEESPTYKPFDFKERLAKIAHAIPE